MGNHMYLNLFPIFTGNTQVSDFIIPIMLQVKQTLDEILEKLPEEFNMADITGKVEERTPYVVVAFQECERMNALTRMIRATLKELDLGFKV